MSISLIVILYLKLAAVATVLLVIALINTRLRGNNGADKTEEKQTRANRFVMYSEPAES